jgi:NAD(P)-dependent dehydrogenase (short-subunit alcohol dehydrogenase family)
LFDGHDEHAFRHGHLGYAARVHLAQIKQEKGKLDVVFANGGGEFVPLGSYTEEHFDKTFDINVKGLVFTVQKALPLLPDGATIVLNGSIVSVKGFEKFGIYTRLRLRSARSRAPGRRN